MSQSSSPAGYFVRARGRITGPFDLPMLQKMVQRGSVSRVHEISEDRVSWSAAREFNELFPAGSDARAGAVSTSPTVPSTPTSSPPAVPASAYFYAQGGNTYGPVPLQMLKLLAENGQLASSDLVWQEGSNTGVRAESIVALGAVYSLSKTAGVVPETTGHSKKILRWASLASAAVLVLGLGSWAGYEQWAKHEVYMGADSKKPGNGPLAAASGAISGLKDEHALAQAVGLVVEGKHIVEKDGAIAEVPIGQGSAFMITPSGLMLTNRHVVEEAVKLTNAKAQREKIRREQLREEDGLVWVFFEGRKYVAEVVYVSAKYDLAVLRVKRTNAPFFKLSESLLAPRGEEVVAIGYPGLANEGVSLSERIEDYVKHTTGLRDVALYFKDRDFSFSLTRGPVSRTYQESGGQTMIQHEAIIRHGNSGGPLVTNQGLVIGINTLLVSRTDEKGDSPMKLSLEISQLKKEIVDNVPEAAIWQ